MTIGHGTAEGALKLQYNLIRNLTSPDEKANGVQTWFANIDAKDVLAIGTRDNLRSYIAEHSASKRTPVHEQIANTIEEMPDRFINRNSGITITCTDCDIDDNKRIVTLQNASIINGAQTQGELRRFFESLEDGEYKPFMVRAEIVMEPLHEQIVEIAIARNTATPVKSVSQAGARGYLDDIKAAIEAALPGETLQMNETDTVGLNAQSVLQWTRLLMPAEFRAGSPRNLAYKQGGRCLADFSEWARKKSSDPKAKRAYDLFVDLAPIAIAEYRYWQQHPRWNGHRLHERGKFSDRPVGGRPVKRDKQTGKVVWVAPGILFPIMSALSAFVHERNGHWMLDKPDLFEEDDLIQDAVDRFREIDRDVAGMGRNELVYGSLSQYTETIAKVLSRIS